MNDIRPVDLPELRAELAGNLANPDWAWFYRDRAEALNRRFEAGVTAEDLQQKEVIGLLCDELFYVSEGMYELAKAAAKSLPPFTLLPEDVPSEFGLAYLAPGTCVPGGSLRSIAAVEWWHVIGAGVRLNFYCLTELMIEELAARKLATQEQIAEQRRLMGRLSPMAAEGYIRFGYDPLDHVIAGDEEFVRSIRAMWLLMQQPLARIAKVEPDRSTRKRLRRIGREPAPVRVIELRRPKSSGDHGDGDREYHHQWIVRGHWRQHWHPKRQVHRPVWIAPHIKGPEGAPMIGGEKVYVLKGEVEPGPPA